MSRVIDGWLRSILGAIVVVEATESALWRFRGSGTLTVMRVWDTIRYGRGTAGARRGDDVFPANEGSLEAMRRLRACAAPREFERFWDGVPSVGVCQ